MTRILAASDGLGGGEADRPPGAAAGPAFTDAVPASLIEAIESVEAACPDLVHATGDAQHAVSGTPRTGTAPTSPS